MTKLYNPNFRMQTMRVGAVTGITYSFFPNRPTEVNDADVEAFLKQGFVIWQEKKTEPKPKRTYNRRRRK